MSIRCVVTGGNGFLGKAVCHWLQRREIPFAILSRREGIDLRDATASARFLRDVKPDCVIHCAAHVGGIAYVREHGVEVFQDNMRIAMGLLEAMHEAGIGRLVSVMPNCTYPGQLEIFHESQWWDGPLHESVICYGLPRKALWGLCDVYAQRGQLRTGHLILPNLYGPGDHFDPIRSHALGAIIARILRALATEAQVITLWGTGNAIREWMYVDDAARAVADYVVQFHSQPPDADNNSIYNVGIGSGISIRDLAEMIGALAGWSGRFEFDVSKPDGAPKKLLDGSRFRALTGWTPSVSLREGIERTLAWCRDPGAPGLEPHNPHDPAIQSQLRGPGDC